MRSTQAPNSAGRTRSSARSGPRAHPAAHDRRHLGADHQGQAVLLPRLRGLPADRASPAQNSIPLASTPPERATSNQIARARVSRPLRLQPGNPDPQPATPGSRTSWASSTGTSPTPRSSRSRSATPRATRRCFTTTQQHGDRSSTSWYNSNRSDQSYTAQLNSDWSNFIPTFTPKLRPRTSATTARRHSTAPRSRRSRSRDLRIQRPRRAASSRAYCSSLGTILGLPGQQHLHLGAGGACLRRLLASATTRSSSARSSTARDTRTHSFRTPSEATLHHVQDWLCRNADIATVEYPLPGFTLSLGRVALLPPGYRPADPGHLEADCPAHYSGGRSHG